MRKMAHGCASLQHRVADVWALPHAQVLTTARKSQLGESTPSRPRKAVDDPPQEWRYVHWAVDRELQPPKHFRFHRIDIPFRVGFEDQPPNTAPVKATGALPWAYKIQGSVLQGLLPNPLGKFPGSSLRKKKKGKGLKGNAPHSLPGTGCDNIS